MSSATNGNRLRVGISTESAGQLIQISSHAATFVYEERLPAERAVSLIMPTEVAVYQTAYNCSIHPVFEMNLPEGRLREELQRRFSKVFSSFDEFTLLRIVGNSTIGRLRFTGALAPFSLQAPPPCDVAGILAYDGVDDLLEYLMDRYSQFSGVAGVQPKVLVQDQKIAGLSDQAKEKLTARDSTHILKTWEGEYPELAANEFFCMQAAGKASLRVAATQLAQNGRLLVVERFDLDKESGSYLGFEDFCALSNLPSRNKYSGSYERLAKGLSLFLAGDALIEARESFFKTMALNCMVRNGDAHLKNFGTLYTEPGIESRKLAPVFDVVTTTAYLPSDSMALMLAGTKRWPDRKKLVEFGIRYCQLTPKEIERHLEQVAEAVTDTRGPLHDYAKNHPKFVEIGKRMLEIWNEGVKSTFGSAWQRGSLVKRLKGSPDEDKARESMPAGANEAALPQSPKKPSAPRP